MPLHLTTTDPDFENAFAVFLAAKREASEDVDLAVRAIIAQVRKDGDKALVELTRRFDRLDLAAAGIRVSEAEIAAAVAASDKETMAALDDLVRAGKVLYIGHSNFAAWQVADAAWIARTAHVTPFVSAQNRYSLVNRDAEQELLPACERFGLGLLPFFPLESGLLTGKYRRGEPPPPGTRLSFYNETIGDEEFDRLDALKRFAEERGRTLLELAIGWLLALEPVASVITGASRPEQIEANVAASTWRLSAEELAAVAAI